VVRKIAALLLTICLIGCGSVEDAASRFADANAEEELGFEQLTFMSWSGSWKGTDIDTELVFNPDGTVLIRHSGTGVDEVAGTYKTTGAKIKITASWEKLVEMPGHMDFPGLIMKRDAGVLYLIPARNTRALHYGSESAWPLKVIRPTTVATDPNAG